MITRPTKPGQRCRIVGSRSQVNGEGPGPNMGREVTTVFLHQQQAADAIPVWRCRAKPGDVLQTYYGAGPEADFLNTWLEVIPETPAQKSMDIAHQLRDLLDA